MPDPIPQWTEDEHAVISLEPRDGRRGPSIFGVLHGAAVGYPLQYAGRTWDTAAELFLAMQQDVPAEHPIALMRRVLQLKNERYGMCLRHAFGAAGARRFVLLSEERFWGASPVGAGVLEGQNVLGCLWDELRHGLPNVEPSSVGCAWGGRCLKWFDGFAGALACAVRSAPPEPPGDRDDRSAYLKARSEESENRYAYLKARSAQELIVLSTHRESPKASNEAAARVRAILMKEFGDAKRDSFGRSNDLDYDHFVQEAVSWSILPDDRRWPMPPAFAPGTAVTEDERRAHRVARIDEKVKRLQKISRRSARACAKAQPSILTRMQAFHADVYGNTGAGPRREDLLVSLRKSRLSSVGKYIGALILGADPSDWRDAAAQRWGADVAKLKGREAEFGYVGMSSQDGWKLIFGDAETAADRKDAVLALWNRVLRDLNKRHRRLELES